MRFTFFTHSLVSDWNHGNAHFLRGTMRALQRMGHDCRAMEPADGWSRSNLIADRGNAAITEFRDRFPDLRSETYRGTEDVAPVLDASDVVIVHEWTAPAIVDAISAARNDGGRFKLLFHDTHHRAVSAAGEIGGIDLSAFDAVLAFGETLREHYLAAGWADQVFTWHEAADDTVFRPDPDVGKDGDLVWVGNWGDGERSAELMEYLLRPAAALGLKATIYGVRYPPVALAWLNEAGIAYGGSIANVRVPAAFARYRITVHVPRRPYVKALPGIPTIRVFEALACGIPLISAPWEDCEGLFRPGTDYLVAEDGSAMTRHIKALLDDPMRAAEQAANGLARVRASHTCRHRAEELLAILDRIGMPVREAAE